MIERPDHPDAERLLKLVNSMDDSATSDDEAMRQVESVINKESLYWVVTMRVFAFLGIESQEEALENAEFVSVLGAGWMEGFLAGTKWESGDV